MEEQGKPVFPMAVASPPVFHHLVKSEERFRGSGRLAGEAAPGEEWAKYICLDLSAGWGLSNRLQTMVLFMIHCNRHRYGMYILWEPNAACPGSFLDVCCIDDAERERLFPCIPFIQIFDSQTSNWYHAKKNPVWCVACIRAQSEVDIGLRFMEEQYQTQTAHLPKDFQEWISTSFRSVNHLESWQVLAVNQEIVEEVLLQDPRLSQESSKWAIHHAVHVRRGDWKVFNCDNKIRELQMLNRYYRCGREQTWMLRYL